MPGKFCCVFLLFLNPNVVHAQETDQRSWLFLSHSSPLSGKWDVLADAQVRSGPAIKWFNTLLLRTGLNYHINKAQSIALGYVSKTDWDREESLVEVRQEHRIYQQYLYNTTIRRSEFTSRARLEERFIRNSAAYFFSGRMRLFAALQLPLSSGTGFTRGYYLNFQDELFCNLLNRKKVNNSVFDQNRLLGSFGYRWSEALDTEIGYLFWMQEEMETFRSSGVIQVMITTSF